MWVRSLLIPSDNIDTSVGLIYWKCSLKKSLPELVCFAGSVVHPAARGGDRHGGTFGQWKELLCESAGKLLSSSARPSAAGWTASAHLTARLPPLQGLST